jgi:hypothetical protein
MPDAAMCAASALLAEFAFRLDRCDGAQVHELFSPGGRYTIDGATLSGREAIERGFAARAARGPRTARHVFTNVRIGDAQPGRVTVNSVMLLWAADGRPPIAGTTPLGIADVTDVLEQLDGRWLFAERIVTTIFRGEGTAVTPMSGQDEPQEGSAVS